MVKYPWSPAEKLHPEEEKKKGFWHFFEHHLPGVSIVLMMVLFVAVLLFPYMVVTVPSGEVGVLWKRFSGPGIYCWCILPRGTVLDPAELRDEGLHVIWPWDTLFLYDLRLQSTTQKYNAISSDGVSVTAEINIRYQLIHNSVAVFHKFIGPGYLASLLAPEIGSETRSVISNFTAQDVYLKRQAIEEQIKAQAQKSLGDHLNALVQPDASEQDNPRDYQTRLAHSLLLLDTLALSIELPPAIVAAINRQTEQYYMIQEYKYRVAREAQESERKRIEADGIAAFQRTVSQGISDSYLRWRGIEATLKLAESSNAKIVIIGTGKDGLPIILGNVDGPPASGPTPPSTGGATPPSGTSPAPTDKTSPGSPSTTAPGGAPTSGASPGADSSGGGSGSTTPSAPDKTPTAGSSPAPGGSDKSSSSSSTLDLSDVGSILSRLSGALRSTGSDASSETGAKPKQ